jgi:hypothetical protein
MFVSFSGSATVTNLLLRFIYFVRQGASIPLASKAEAE